MPCARSLIIVHGFRRRLTLLASVLLGINLVPVGRRRRIQVAINFEGGYASRGALGTACRRSCGLVRRYSRSAVAYLPKPGIRVSFQASIRISDSDRHRGQENGESSGHVEYDRGGADFRAATVSPARQFRRGREGGAI